MERNNAHEPQRQSAELYEIWTDAVTPTTDAGATIWDGLVPDPVAPSPLNAEPGPSLRAA